MTGHIKIEKVVDMYDLQAAMQQVEFQAIDIEQYVTTWVCQKDGFEPSPICVLKPLAGAMDKINEAFGSACTTFFTKWGSVREEVGRTTQDFQRQEHETVSSLDGLLGRAQTIKLPNGKVIGN